MPQTNNTERLRTWLRTCPLVAKRTRFGADYMTENATEYGVFSVPSSLRYRENILGEQVPTLNQEQNFIFASKAPYGSDIKQNLENLGFWQDVVSWIWEQNDAQNFPEWDGGHVKSIVPTLTGALTQAGSDAARYQIQLRVSYQIDF